MESLFSKIKEGLKAAADIALPRLCIVCKDRLYLKEEHICLHCLSEMPMTYFWSISHNKMADKFNGLIQQRIDMSSDSEPGYKGEHYAYACALFYFQDDSPYRHILYDLKYRGHLNQGRFFARILGRKMVSAEWFKSVDAVVPVPLHWKRKWMRGYNQSEIIGAELAKEMGVPLITDILKRKRNTKTQTKLDIGGKASNVEGAFDIIKQVNDHNLRHLVLVDDLFTTGSTALACFTALREVYPPSVRISVATLGFVGRP